MSATLAPFGLRPVSHPSGEARAHAYYGGITSGYSTNLYAGTPVVLATSAATSQVQVAANGADMIGAFDGVQYTDSNGRPAYAKRWTASAVATDIIAYVYDDPLTIYEIQAEGSLAIAALGDQANFASTSGYAVGDGNATTQLSTTAVSTTLAGAGVQGMLRIIDVAKYVDNAWGDTYTIIQVQIARSQYVSNKVAI